jgi:hypothetical protein
MSILDQAVVLRDEVIPDDIPLMKLADSVVRGEGEALATTAENVD